MASSESFFEVHRSKIVAVIVVLAIGLIGVVVWANLRTPANNANFPEGTWWICKDGHTFHLTLKELSDHHAQHYGQPVKCPDGTEAVRAEKCPHCGTISAAQRNSDICPNCKQHMDTTASAGP